VYEHHDQPLLTRRAFLVRMLRHSILSVVLLAGSLVLGIVGYMALAHLRFVDAFLNAAMILGGMGPVDLLLDDGAKIFAGLYALYSGIVFLVVVGVVFAPIFHRIIHRLHLDATGKGRAPDDLVD
jgi:hypothetical protein